ncbi:hypothetical protein NQ317_017295 [Molorchus minor]|uniref:Uncharacterized protein n=1 Tax=Molorchus minor TaxID=1323400 RepID=A0ABQ9JUT2_9CUCU|nr:hypothetical protein NQ317_017295 [Molorchus minor]
MFSTAANSCSRLVQPGVTGELIFNITTLGKCLETNTSTKAEHHLSLLMLIWLLLYILHTQVLIVIQR